MTTQRHLRLRLLSFFILLSTLLVFFAVPRQHAAAASHVTLLPQRDSTFTQKGSGPLYWSTYGYNIHAAGSCCNGGPIPESAFQNNIDWVAANFASSGYKMVVTDGWLSDSIPVDANGYITTYNDWTHDWSYWVNYLAGKNMTLGVYWNCFWVPPRAIQQNANIVGTSIPVDNILGQSFDLQPSFYWIDPTKNGAQQWVEGCVNHFKSIGVKLLREDFLIRFSWGVSATSYDTALSWLSDAAGNDIMLSFVQPTCANDCAIELKYGDMFKQAPDTFYGGWGPFASNNRSSNGLPIRSGWPPFDNVWDALAYYAHVMGPSKGIIDGDSIQLNSFASDDERRTVISLYTMAGAPIPIADDCTSSTGDPSSCPTVPSNGTGLDIFRNSEVLGLNQAGLVGHPLANGTTVGDSERWMGQLSDGSVIVGLFNREDTTQTRSVNYQADLGISGATPTRNLWSHTDLGSLTSYSVTLAPHASVLLKLKPSSPPATWENLSGYTVDGPAICSQSSSRLDVFIRGGDQQLWQESWNGSTWSGWNALGGPTGGIFQGKPAAVSWGNGRIDVVVRGTDNAVWHRWLSGGTWSGWESLGGYTVDSPSISSQGNGLLDIFIRGGDNHLYEKSWTGSTWTAWTPLGGPASGTFAGSPTSVSWGSGRIDVFVRGTDNAVWHRWFDGGTWSSWESLGGYTVNNPAASSAGASNLAIFVRGGDNQLYEKTWNGSTWSSWSALGGPTSGTIGSDPAAVGRSGTSTTDVVVGGTDSAVYHKAM